MGMFDKDKEIGRQMTDVFPPRTEFILWAVQVQENAVVTDFGPADKTEMTVSKTEDPNRKFTVNSLGGAIADKAKQADPDEFPAVVEWFQVNSKFSNRATVLQFVRAYVGSSERHAPAQTAPSTGSEDDIPF